MRRRNNNSHAVNEPDSQAAQPSRITSAGLDFQPSLWLMRPIENTGASESARREVASAIVLARRSQGGVSPEIAGWMTDRCSVNRFRYAAQCVVFLRLRFQLWMFETRPWAKRGGSFFCAVT